MSVASVLLDWRITPEDLTSKSLPRRLGEASARLLSPLL
jgi:hypothetical protein